mgnify:FL=1
MIFVKFNDFSLDIFFASGDINNLKIPLSWSLVTIRSSECILLVLDFILEISRLFFSANFFASGVIKILSDNEF